MIKRGKWTIDKTSKILPAFYNTVLDTYGQCEAILVEKQGFQPALVSTIKTNHPQLPIHSVSIKNIPKEDRMETVALVAQQGRLFINQGSKEYPALVSELVGYMNASNDDIADTLSLPFYWGKWSPAMELKSAYHELEIVGFA